MNSFQDSLKNWPRDRRENALYRIELIRSATPSKEAQIQIAEYARRNALWWINTFCWTVDPRKKPNIIPFICYDDFQIGVIEQIINAIRVQEDLLGEKTRDMGFTWMVVYTFVHQWLYEPGSDFLMGSWKEDYVDKIGDMDTLFEKIRFTLGRLPPWMLPEGFLDRDHSSYAKLINPVLKNTIVGEAPTVNFGRSGRRRAIFLDEFAFWDASVAEAAWRSTADTTKCRLAASTPNGGGNKFAQLAKGTKERIKKMTLHWSLHPEKSKDSYYFSGDSRVPVPSGKRAFELWQSGIRIRSPWYDEECIRRKEQDVAQELDIDYLKSGNPFFSLIPLKTQRIWRYKPRRAYSDDIPYGEHIRANIVDVDQSVQLRDSDNGLIRIFELPNPHKEYVLGADVSEGLPQGDESFAVVREKYMRNVVAAFNCLLKPEEFAYYVYLLSEFYGRALVGCELNNHGYTTNLELYRLGANIFYTDKDSQGKQIEPKRGVITNQFTRPLMLDQAEEEVRTASAEIRDEAIVLQMETFVNAKNGKPQADVGFLDDGVMGFAIAGYLIQVNPSKAKPVLAERNSNVNIELLMQKKKNAGFSFRRA